jgi:hypothetical protein
MTKRRRTRQYNDQKKKDKTIEWQKEEGQDNTMTKRRRTRQYNDQKKKDKTIEWPKEGQDNTMTKRKKTKGQRII